MKSDWFFGPATKGLPKKCTMLLPVKTSHSTMPFLPTGPTAGLQQKLVPTGLFKKQAPMLPPSHRTIPLQLITCHFHCKPLSSSNNTSLIITSK